MSKSYSLDLDVKLKFVIYPSLSMEVCPHRVDASLALTWCMDNWLKYYPLSTGWRTLTQRSVCWRTDYSQQFSE